MNIFPGANHIRHCCSGFCSRQVIVIPYCCYTVADAVQIILIIRHDTGVEINNAEPGTVIGFIKLIFPGQRCI